MTQTENIAEIELVYKPSISNKPIITSPLDAYNVVGSPYFSARVD